MRGGESGLVQTKMYNNDGGGSGKLDGSDTGSNSSAISSKRISYKDIQAGFIEIYKRHLKNAQPQRIG